MTDFRAVLAAVCPHGKKGILDGFAKAFPDLAAKYAINTKLRQAHFIAQCAHESAGLLTTREYASGREYEGRRDLGNTHAGDGVTFKGRGLIQLTGRANYARYGEKLGVNLVANPGLAEQFPWAVLTAGQYWADHELNEIADKDDVLRITKRVNGGTNGLEGRKVYLAKAKKALGI